MAIRHLRPQIIRLSACRYQLLSHVSGNTYQLGLDDEWQPRAFFCTCPASTYCWHAAAILREHTRRSLTFGDRVLVNELSGLVWHTVLYGTDRVVFTEEVPEGFSLPFVVEVERLKMAGRAA